MRELFKILIQSIKLKAEHSRHQFFLYGTLTFLGFLSFFFINRLLGFYEQPHVLAIRIICALLSLALALHRRWPTKLTFCLPPFWFLTLTVNLPFFFYYMFILNPNDVNWQINLLMSFVVLVVLTDWITSLVIIVVGASIAHVLALITSVAVVWPNNFLGIIISFATILIYCAAFIYKKEQFYQEKLRTAEALGGMIAHEARTPLASLGLCLDGMQEDSQSHIEIKPSTFDKPFFLLKKLNWIIDSLLLNIKSLDTSYGVKNVSIGQLVEEAVMNYPLTDPEKTLFHLQLDHAFVLQTKPELFQHLLSNLIKNALYAIKKKGSGDITIKTYQDEKGCSVLEFMDTGSGIPKKHLSHLFETFFTTKTNGVGLGLAFVKKVVAAADGTISCSSVEGDLPSFVCDSVQISF